MSEELITVKGRCYRQIYRNEQTFYTVFLCAVKQEKKAYIPVVGSFVTAPLPNENLILKGHYIDNNRYGREFEAVELQIEPPDGKQGYIRFLSGTKFPGIGKKNATKIVNALGEEGVETLKDHLEKIDHLDFLSVEQKASLKNGIGKESDQLEVLASFLTRCNVGLRYLEVLNRTYGKNAIEIMKTNPYQILKDCQGIGFSTVDVIGGSVGIAKDDKRRLLALLVDTVMQTCYKQGDTYLEKEEVFDAFVKRTPLLTYDYDLLFHKAVDEGQLIQKQNYIYTQHNYLCESTIANFLHAFPYDVDPPISLKDIDGAIEKLEEESGLQYDDNQKKAIQQFFQVPLMILTGGPGTGKTTVVKAFVSLYQQFFPVQEMVIAAPTGRAAKRMSEITGCHASTIHSLLKWDLDKNCFNVNEDNPLTCDCLIIDEFSMVDNDLFYHLTLACKNVKRICIIGDEDQLPSIREGSLLRDLIACQRFPLVRLTNVHRQKEGSGVIALSQRIKKGDADLCRIGNDVKFIECDKSKIQEGIVKIIRFALEKNYTLADIQVLCPLYRGSLGILKLNELLQDTFNPCDDYDLQCQHGGQIYRINDKILQLKNQPDDDVYNGDIGILEDIYESYETLKKQPVLLVDFDGRKVEYKGEALDNITHAYCISVHKSQGCEYPIVILPLAFDYSIMLQRKLLYTACTRARSALILIGERGAYEKGIRSLESHQRKTGLQQAILSFSNN